MELIQQLSAETFNGFCPLPCPFGVPINNTVFVDSEFGNDKKGCPEEYKKPFKTIQAALDVIVMLSFAERWQVIVNPGDYFTGDGITIEGNIDIVGSGLSSVIRDSIFIRGDVKVTMKDFALNADGIGAPLFLQNGPALKVDNLHIKRNIAGATPAPFIFFIQNGGSIFARDSKVDFDTTNNIDVFFVQGGGDLFIRDLDVNAATSSSGFDPIFFIDASGAGNITTLNNKVDLTIGSTTATAFMDLSGTWDIVSDDNVVSFTNTSEVMVFSPVPMYDASSATVSLLSHANVFRDLGSAFDDMMVVSVIGGGTQSILDDHVNIED